MEALIGLVGIIALIAAVVWMVSPLGRWRLSRLAEAVVVLAVALLIAVVVWQELIGNQG